jgi:hypothetical protein
MMKKMPLSRKIQQKRASRKQNQKIKKSNANRIRSERKQIIKALERVAYAKIDNPEQLDEVLEKLDPYQYGKTWGVGGDKKLQAKMDKIVADEIERLERSVTDTDEVGNIKFGDSE